MATSLSEFSAHLVLTLDLFADGNDFSWQAIQQGRIRYYQRQLANQIQSKTEATLDLLTEALHIHLNIGQSMTMNTSSVFMSLETVTTQSLSSRTLHPSGPAYIQLPSTLQLTPSNETTLSLRVCSSSLTLTLKSTFSSPCSSP